MTASVCSKCGQESLDAKGRCANGCKPPSLWGRQRLRSSDLADRIAARSADTGYAVWQRTVITDVVHGGGVAGYILVLSTVAVCAFVFLLVHRGTMRLLHTEHSPGAIFYLVTVPPVAVLYFRLAAPLFYRLHVWLSDRRAV